MKSIMEVDLEHVVTRTPRRLERGTMFRATIESTRMGGDALQKPKMFVYWRIWRYTKRVKKEKVLKNRPYSKDKGKTMHTLPGDKEKGGK